ncbi:MAG: nuclear transport factor 2 family protein [Pseudomonadota bacterium]|nr:nuclear transport factor 2 family protein [Pseudomonadota bacterium]
MQTEEKKIKEIIYGIFESFENHDPDGIENHMHPDSTVWDVFTPQLIQGAEEREKFHTDDQTQMQSRGKLSMTIKEPVINVWSDTAIARYYLTYSYEPPNPASGNVRITDVFRKIKNKWLIVHHHEGAVPDGVPPITE